MKCKHNINAIYKILDDWGKGRELPEFAKESFNEMWKKNKVQGKEETK